MCVPQNSEMILPFWLKMFSNKSENAVNQLDNKEATLKFSHDSLLRIAKLIGSGKIVILMGKDKPYKIYRDENNEITVEPIDHFRFK